MSDYGEVMALYGAWQRGELKAEGLEAKARILAGYDSGNAEPLTADEREFMAREASRLTPEYPYAKGIALNDGELAEWWLLAMEDYVQDKFGW